MYGTKNNEVKIAGRVTEGFSFSHELFGEGFYYTKVAVTRLSDIDDILPVIVSERIVDVNQNLEGRNVELEGEWRSYNKHIDGKSQLKLYVFVKKIIFRDTAFYGENKVVLDGYLCKTPIYRKTPLGREVTEVLVAVNRAFGKSDYIPCIFWGKSAKYMAKMEIGDNIKLKGRIQSRECPGKNESGGEDVKVVYEISVSSFEIINNV